ncbi:MAG: T9SS type A sorting domain-containing protein [Bacteroidia bacterium]|nr:T9SS type A sorting domain-containing protein [Bacteroidia bacterium]MDW8015777.1 T9SS type A sorting domain-containing protein [Bacteroidia bacterium]
MRPRSWIVTVICACAWAQQRIALPAEATSPLLRALETYSTRQTLNAFQRRVEWSPLINLNFRTANLAWLLPNQDYVTIPATPSTEPDFAEDTLISNGVGPNTRQNPPAACVGTFFDSLLSAFAYPVFGIERDTILRLDIQGTLYYLCTNGGVAERYDIVPRRAGSAWRVGIKGVATAIINFAGSQPCEPATSAPSPDPVADGAYTLFYRIYPAERVMWPLYDPPRAGAKPSSDSIIAEVTKPLSQVRLINRLLDEEGPNCPEVSQSFLEVFDFAYFESPVVVRDSGSYYIALESEVFNRNTFNLADTLYFFMGPRTSGDIESHPCLTGDTLFAGRSVFSVGLYNASTGVYEGAPVLQGGFIVDWAPVGGIAAQLNFVLFPIIYAYEDQTASGTWINGGTQSIMTPYPNPTTECLNLRFESQRASEIRLTLYSLEGRIVKAWSPFAIPAGEAQLSVDVHDIPSGTYILRVESELARAAFEVTVLH